jgi:hypothetical protein
LTAPETVAIIPEQYWQAVDLLASVILSYHHTLRCSAAQPGVIRLRTADPPLPGLSEAAGYDVRAPPLDPDPCGTDD